MSRAEKAGRQFGIAVAELAQLFYQNNTKKNFFKGLLDVLKEVANG